MFFRNGYADLNGDNGVCLYLDLTQHPLDKLFRDHFWNGILSTWKAWVSQMKIRFLRNKYKLAIVFRRSCLLMFDQHVRQSEFFLKTNQWNHIPFAIQIVKSGKVQHHVGIWDENNNDNSGNGSLDISHQNCIKK